MGRSHSYLGGKETARTLETLRAVRDNSPTKREEIVSLMKHRGPANSRSNDREEREVNRSAELAVLGQMEVR